MDANGKRPIVRAIAIEVATLAEQLVAQLIEWLIDWAKGRRQKRLDQR